MKREFNFILVIVFILISTSLRGQSVEPFRIAVTVSNIEESSKWYEEVFELKYIKKCLSLSMTV